MAVQFAEYNRIHTPINEDQRPAPRALASKDK
jgi:hypothetical protein